MLRKAALLVCLSAPFAAGAQTSNSGPITFSPDAVIGAAECPSTTDTISMTWTLGTGTGGSTVGAYMRIFTSNNSTCTDARTDGKFATQIGTDFDYVSNTQSYPGVGDAPVTPSALVTGAGYGCTGADQTIYICVEQFPGTGDTSINSAKGTIKLQLAAPNTPNAPSVAPGDQALNVSWTDGTTGGGATPASWRVTAICSDATQDPSPHEQTTTRRSLRMSGLVNLTAPAEYEVTVVAISEGANESPESAPGFGRPQPVNDFYSYYTDAGGTEQGGCGGPAGALSLLSLAALLGVLRRRS
jgi:hypothetical protein